MVPQGLVRPGTTGMRRQGGRVLRPQHVLDKGSGYQ